MITAALSGLGLGLSLIVAIGAQNLFVLRQGLRREHAGVVAAVCAISDAALIALGVSGVGLAAQSSPWLLVAVRWTGCAFLIGYGALAARRALRPAGATLAAATDDGEAPPPRGAPGTATRTALIPTALTCLALTWFNPHVYLDTVFLLGGVAAAHGDDRWWFAVGAVLASCLWFPSLAFGARFLGRILGTAGAWRILDGLIAVVMVVLGVSLALGG